MQPPIDSLLPSFYEELHQTTQEANEKLTTVLAATSQQLQDELSQPRKKYRRSKGLNESTEADASPLPLDVQPNTTPALLAALASASMCFYEKIVTLFSAGSIKYCYANCTIDNIHR